MAAPAVNQEGWEGYKTFIWNPTTREFLGKTGSSWIKLILFYIIFYACLAGFFATCLWIFWGSLDPNAPKFFGADGLIGNSPGVGFRPMPDKDENVEIPIIKYNQNSPESYDKLVQQLKKFIQDSEDASHGELCKDGPAADRNLWCKMAPIPATGECSETNNYGYPEGKPCILIKLNKIYGWRPDPYVATDDLANLQMPEDLKSKIKSSKEPRVWFSCEGARDTDRENLEQITYYPDQGVSVVHYPYWNQKGYKSPFIFVKLGNVKPGTPVFIDCKAWDKQIHHDKVYRLGMVGFGLMIEN